MNKKIRQILTKNWPVAILILMGLVDVGVTLWEMEPPHGKRWLIRTPGAVLYHLVFLPVVVWVLMDAWRTKGFQAIWVGRRGASIAVIGACVLSLCFYGLTDKERSFDGRTLKPMDVQAGDTQRYLLNAEYSLREEDNSEKWWNCIELDEDPRPPDDREIATRRIVYRWAVKNKFQGDYSKFEEERSFGSLWGGLLSGIAGLCGGIFIGMVLSAALLGADHTGDESKKLTDGLLLVWVSAVTWIPPRLWSEHYSEFGDVQGSDYQALKTAFILFVGVIALLGLMRIRSLTESVFSAAASLVAVAVFVWNPSLLSVLDQLETPSVLLVQAFGALFFVAAIRVLWARAQSS